MADAADQRGACQSTLRLRCPDGGLLLHEARGPGPLATSSARSQLISFRGAGMAAS